MSVHICLHARYRMCICAHVCAVCSFSVGNENGGVQLVYESTCCLAWGLFLTEGKIGVLSVSSLFLTRVEVYACASVCIRTHTHIAQVLGCEPRSPDETPGGPEESRWTKS